MVIWHRITSDHKSMKLGINNGKNLGKFATLSHTTRLSQRTQKGDQNILRQMTMEMQTSKGTHKMPQEGCVCTQGSPRGMSVQTRFYKRNECAHKGLQEGCVCTQGVPREMSVHTGFSKRDEYEHRVLQEGWVCTQGAPRRLIQQQKPAFKTVNWQSETSPKRSRERKRKPKISGKNNKNQNDIKPRNPIEIIIPRVRFF